jgi:hypothetical protein
MREVRKEAQKAPGVPARATQGAEARNWSWVEASVWTDRMVSALENGVKGGRWYSLIDKVSAPATLEAAWDKVRANAGAAGVDRQSVERFEANEDLYLAELVRRCVKAATGRSRSGGSTSRRAMAGRDHWESQRSRIASCRRL